MFQSDRHFRTVDMRIRQGAGELYQNIFRRPGGLNRRTARPGGLPRVIERLELHVYGISAGNLKDSVTLESTCLNMLTRPEEYMLIQKEDYILTQLNMGKEHQLTMHGI